MKKTYLLVILTAIYSHAQEVKNPDNFKLNLSLRLGYNFAIPTGNNAVNKALNPSWGISDHVDLISYHHFRVGFGANILGYKVDDREAIGDFSDALYLSVYGGISYNYKFSDKWIFTPMAGVGSGGIGFTGPHLRVQDQHGTEFRLGGFGDYAVGKHTFVFVGLFYTTVKFKVRTTPEYEKFYSQAHQFQLSMGVNFD